MLLFFCLEFALHKYIATCNDVVYNILLNWNKNHWSNSRSNPTGNPTW